LWERKDILAFCLAFPLEHKKQAKKNQNITFFIFGYPFSSFIGDAFRGQREEAVGGIFCFSFKMHIKIT
jgi:hypothetical protein